MSFYIDDGEVELVRRDLLQVLTDLANPTEEQIARAVSHLQGTLAEPFFTERAQPPSLRTGGEGGTPLGWFLVAIGAAPTWSGPKMTLRIVAMADQSTDLPWWNGQVDVSMEDDRGIVTTIFDGQFNPLSTLRTDPFKEGQFNGFVDLSIVAGSQEHLRIKVKDPVSGIEAVSEPFTWIAP